MSSWLKHHAFSGVGLILSALGIWYLVGRVDIASLIEKGIDFRPEYLAGISVLFAVQYAVLSARWRLLVGGIGFRVAAESVIMAYGGNAALPARGGDALRILLLKKDGRASYSRSVYASVVEKVMDLGMVLCMALLAASLSDRGFQRLIVLSVVVLLFFVAAVYAFNNHRGRILNVLLQVLSGLRLPPSFLDRLVARVASFDTTLGRREMILAFGQTALLWLLLFPAYYWLAIRAIGVSTDYAGICLIVSFGALGLALPSAPSGIGVYHAAVVSVLEMLGHDGTSSIAVAAWMHALNTIPIALLALLVHFRRFRLRDRPNREGAA